MTRRLPRFAAPRPKCPGCTFPVHFFEGEPGHVVRCVRDRAVWIGFGPVGQAPEVPRRLVVRLRG